MKLEERIDLSELFVEYGSLLTDKQREMVELYCCLDLSLNEISEQMNISRQGVRDHISHAKASLENYELKLGVVKFKRKLNELAFSNADSKEAIQQIRKLLEE